MADNDNWIVVVPAMTPHAARLEYERWVIRNNAPRLMPEEVLIRTGRASNKKDFQMYLVLQSALKRLGIDSEKLPN